MKRGEKGFTVITGGMIGFMEKCIAIEQKCRRRRYALYRHVPQFIRDKDLTKEEFAETRSHWQPEGLWEYFNLLQQRRRVIRSLIGKGSCVTKEMYDRSMTDRFARTGTVFSGENASKWAEKRSRLHELLRLLEEYDCTRYELRFTDTSPWTAFLVCDDELVIDVGRQIGRRFDGVLGGLYTADKDIVEAYVATFNGLWRADTRSAEVVRAETMGALTEWLNQMPDAPAGRTHPNAAAAGKTVFVAMPFQKEFLDVYEIGIRPAVKKCGLVCHRVDENHSTNDIVQDIKEGIESAAVMIADLTKCRPNVSLEAGYAMGQHIPVIFLMREKGKPPFNVSTHPFIFYTSGTELAAELEKTLRGLIARGKIQ